MDADQSMTESAPPSPWVMIDGQDSLEQLWMSINAIRDEQYEARDNNTRMAHTLQLLLTKVHDKLEAVESGLSGMCGRLDAMAGRLDAVIEENEAHTRVQTDVDAKLLELGQMLQGIEKALDEKSSLDIRQQNRRIRQHIPFTFKPTSSGQVKGSGNL